MPEEAAGDDFAPLPEQLQAKLARCREIIQSLGRVVVAFSGGVDSTLLLALSAEAVGAENVLAAVGVSPSLPARELDEARSLAGRLGVRLMEVPTAELDDPDYTANPPDRCFYCKRELLARLGDLARAEGFDQVVTGANFDDLGDLRPGLLAGEQMGAANPLMEAAFTKQEVRAAAAARKLPNWDKPASACLASRIPYGQAVTPEGLARIERAEEALHQMGFAACRVRDHGDVARIEVPPEAIGKAVELRERIVESVKAAGYAFVALDLAGYRTGSMNEPLGARE